MLDAFVFWRERGAAAEIVLVTIDGAAFRELGERQPLSRRYLAELGELLLTSGARVVAFDILMNVRSTAEDDAALGALLRRWDTKPDARVVLASVAVRDRGLPADTYLLERPVFEAPAIIGFADVPIGSDGMIRRMAPTLPARDGRLLPSFALATVAAYGGYSDADVATAVSKDRKAVVLLANSGRDLLREPISVDTLTADWRIDFVGPAGSFTTFPSGPLVALARSTAEPGRDNVFHGRIVLVGATFAEAREIYATPAGPMSGVEIHANMVHTLLTRRFLASTPWPVSLAMSIAACLALAWLSVRVRPAWTVLAAVVAVVVLALASYAFFRRAAYWLDIVPPVVSMLAYLGASAVLRRRRVRSALGLYVSRTVSETVWRTGVDLEGEMREVSILVSDLRDFTRLCEATPAAEVSEMLNEYLESMVDPIMANRGIVIDFVGDGILAAYGAPLEDHEHAIHAVRSAVRMQEALDDLNRRWQQGGRPRLRMGIAVHSGQAFAGTIGSPRRKKYAILGDPVNTAARVEGLNRDLDTTILLTEPILSAVRDAVVVNERGSMAVKGKVDPVQVFELVRLVSPLEQGQ